MPKKELVATFEGHDIRVVNTWFSGAKLYIDGDCRDTSNEIFAVSGGSPLLSASLETPNGARRIEVFIKAILTTKIKVCVDDEMIAGERF